MGSVVLNPSGASAAANWANPANALYDDGGLYATNASGTGWLYFDFAPNALPSGAAVAGLALSVDCGDRNSNLQSYPFGYLGGELEGPALFPRLEVQTSSDAGATWSARRFVDAYRRVGLGAQTLGGDGDLWGLSGLAASLGTGSFMVRARRPQDADEAGGSRYLESIRATLWWTDAPETQLAEETKVLKRVLIGLETTPGDPSTVCARQITSADIVFSPNPTIKEFRGMGFKMPIAHRKTDEDPDASLDGHPDYNEVGFWLASVFGKPVSEMVVTGVYRHTFTLNERGSSDPRTFLVEYSQADASTTRVRFAILNAFGLTGGENRPDVGMSGSWFGTGFDPAASPSGGVNEVQTLTITGTPTTLNYSYKGKSGSIAVAGLTAAALQAALVALSTVGAGGMVVSGSGPYLVTAAGSLAGQPLERIEVSTTGGTGSASCIRTTPGGHTVTEPVPILPEDISAYLADTYDTLGSGKLGRNFAWGFALTDRYDKVKAWGTTGYVAVVEKKDLKAGLEITVAADSVSQSLIAAWRAGQRKHSRVEAVGPIIASAIPYRLQLDVSAEVSESKPYSVAGEVVAYGVTLGGTTDLVLGRSVRVVLVNKIPSY